MDGKELVEHQGETDALFWDIDMPGLDGIEAGRILHKRGFSVGRMVFYPGNETASTIREKYDASVCQLWHTDTVYDIYGYCNK